MPTPIITLTTDFGLADHYAGTMKGVILNRCPHAHIVDISHDVPKFSVLAGAYTIDQAARYFPRGTVHVVVIDPGVGSERKALLVEAMHQIFIAPDNGVLSFIFARDRRARVREISNRELSLPNPSATFHGRDIFAPAAATIAAEKVWPDDAGPLFLRPVHLTNLDPQEQMPHSWNGTVLSVDHFGNVITNFSTTRFAPRFNSAFTLVASAAAIQNFRPTFAGASDGACFVYAGSSGYLEIGINQGNAAAELGLKPADSLRLEIPG